MMPKRTVPFGSPLLSNPIHNHEEITDAFGTEHLDAGVAEILQTLEQRAGGQMAAYVHYATPLVQTGYTVQRLLLEHIHFPLEAGILP